jgi:hypothetical protein
MEFESLSTNFAITTVTPATTTEITIETIITALATTFLPAENHCKVRIISSENLNFMEF